MVGTSSNGMKDLPDRLKSFALWPSTVPIKPKKLAEAGFFYVGEHPTDDTVCCFSCEGRLNGWEAGDDPEEKHRRYFGSHCEFLRNREIGMSGGFRPGERRRHVREQQNHFDPIDNDDMENERQRIRSFQRNNGWKGVVAPEKLAAAGFYYMGISDHVKCFACDLSLCRWDPEDDPISEHLKNQPDCPFLIGLSSRRATVPSSASGSSNVFYHSLRQYTETITAARQEPYHYTNNTVHSSSGNQQSRFHVGLCMPEQTYAGEPTRSITQTSAANSLYQPTIETSHNHPVPNYAKENARLHTFINWPKACPVQPKELIDAGFYYTGEDDKARCFMCGVLLAGWEPEDTPWGEHEKWSKDCPLVKERLRRRNPHSPVSGGTGAQAFPKEQSWYLPTAGKKAPGQMTTSHINLRPFGSKEDTCEPVKTNHSPNEQDESHGKEGISKTTTRKNTGKELFYIEKAVQELLDRGYDLGLIEETIQYKTKICKESIDSLEELLDAISSFSNTQSKSGPKSSTCTGIDTEEGNLDVVKVVESSEQKHTLSEEGTGFSLSVDPEALHQQVKKMHEAHTCKICLDAEIGVVFLPCGHLVCCTKCATEIQTKTPPLCPVCRKQIENIIRTYLP